MNHFLNRQRNTHKHIQFSAVAALGNGLFGAGILHTIPSMAQRLDLFIGRVVAAIAFTGHIGIPANAGAGRSMGIMFLFNMAQLGNGLLRAAQFLAALFHRAEHHQVMAAILSTGRLNTVLLYRRGRLMTQSVDCLRLAADLMGLANRAIHHQVVAAGILAIGLHTVLFHRRGRLMAQSVDGHRLATQFNTAGVTIHHRVVAASILTISILAVLLNRRFCRMVLGRLSVNLFSIGLAIRAGIGNIALLCTGGFRLHTIFHIKLMGLDLAGEGFTAQFRITGRAIHHHVIATGGRTCSLNTCIFILDRVSLRMAGSLVNNSLAAGLLATLGAVSHLVVAAVNSTVGGDRVLHNHIAIGMAIGGNRLLSLQNVAANRALLASGQTGVGAIRSNGGNCLYGVAQSVHNSVLTADLIATCSTIHNGVIATVVIAIGQHIVFDHRFAFRVARSIQHTGLLLNGLVTHSTISHRVIAAVHSTTRRRNLILCLLLALRMAQCIMLDTHGFIAASTLDRRPASISTGRRFAFRFHLGAIFKVMVQGLHIRVLGIQTLVTHGAAHNGIITTALSTGGEHIVLNLCFAAVMAIRIHIGTHIGILATGTGISGIALLRTGGGSHGAFIVMRTGGNFRLRCTLRFNPANRAIEYLIIATIFQAARRHLVLNCNFALGVPSRGDLHVGCVIAALAILIGVPTNLSTGRGFSRDLFKIMVQRSFFTISGVTTFFAITIFIGIIADFGTGRVLALNLRQAMPTSRYFFISSIVAFFAILIGIPTNLSAGRGLSINLDIFMSKFRYISVLLMILIVGAGRSLLALLCTGGSLSLHPITIFVAGRRLFHIGGVIANGTILIVVPADPLTSRRLSFNLRQGMTSCCNRFRLSTTAGRTSKGLHARLSTGRSGIDYAFAPAVTIGLNFISHIAVAAGGTGVRGIATFGTSRSGHICFISVTIGLYLTIHVAIAANGTSVRGIAILSTGRVSHNCIIGVTIGRNFISHVAVVANGTSVRGIATFGTSRSGHICFISVTIGLYLTIHVAIAANGTSVRGIAILSTGRVSHNSVIAMSNRLHIFCLGHAANTTGERLHACSSTRRSSGYFTFVPAVAILRNLLIGGIITTRTGYIFFVTLFGAGRGLGIVLDLSMSLSRNDLRRGLLATDVTCLVYDTIAFACGFNSFSSNPRMAGRVFNIVTIAIRAVFASIRSIAALGTRGFVHNTLIHVIGLRQLLIFLLIQDLFTDGAIRHQGVAALCGTGSLDNILLAGIRLMAQCVNSFRVGIATRTASKGLHTFLCTGGRRGNHFAVAVIDCSLFLIGCVITNRTILVVIPANLGTSRILCLNLLQGMAQGFRFFLLIFKTIFRTPAHKIFLARFCTRSAIRNKFPVVIQRLNLRISGIITARTSFIGIPTNLSTSGGLSIMVHFIMTQCFYGGCLLGCCALLNCTLVGGITRLGTGRGGHHARIPGFVGITIVHPLALNILEGKGAICHHGSIGISTVAILQVSIDDRDRLIGNYSAIATTLRGLMSICLRTCTSNYYTRTFSGCNIGKALAVFTNLRSIHITLRCVNRAIYNNRCIHPRVSICTMHICCGNLGRIICINAHTIAQNAFRALVNCDLGARMQCQILVQRHRTRGNGNRHVTVNWQLKFSRFNCCCSQHRQLHRN